MMLRKSLLVVLAIVLLPIKSFGAVKNNSSNNVSGYPHGVTLTGVSYPLMFSSNSSTGNLDIYTVPTGKKVFIGGMTIYNGGVSTITYYITIKKSGTYYRLTANNTITANNGTVTASTNIAYIANAGEIISVNTDNSGGNIWFRGVQFDSTVPIFSSGVFGMANGNNTIYTVSSGKSAMILDSQFFLTATSTGIFYINDSGASRNIISYAVPSGGSPGTTNEITASAGTAVADKAKGNVNANMNLSSGDFIVVNTNSGTATQSAWVNVVEI